MEDYLPAAALLLEALVLVWIGKMAAGLALRRRIDHELTTVDNAAVALFISGFFLGLFIALSGALTGPSRDLGQDVQALAIHGGLAIACLLVSMLFWEPFFKVRILKELFEQKSVGDGIVAAAVLTATGLVYRGSLQGEGGSIEHVLAFFGLGQLCLYVMSFAYQLVTPFDVHREISENKNIAAAVGFAGAIVAFGIVLSNAARGDFNGWSESLKEFALMAAPVVLLYPIRLVAVNGLLLGFRDLNREIERDKNIGAGLIEAVAYVGIALVVVELL